MVFNKWRDFVMEFEQLVPENINSALNFELERGKTSIVGAPAYEPPFAVDAMVIEEDRFLVLNPPSEVIHKPRASIGELILDAATTLPLDSGTVLIKMSRPLQFLAIVHDLDQDPSWREEWIIQALATIIEESKQRSLEVLAIPFLGSQHGSLSKQHAFVLLQQVLIEQAPRFLRKIWLMTTSPHPVDTFELIDQD